MARASLEETRYHGLLARDLRYIQPSEYDEFEAKAERISRMLNALLRALRAKAKSDK